MNKKLYENSLKFYTLTFILRLKNESGYFEVFKDTKIIANNIKNATRLANHRICHFNSLCDDVKAVFFNLVED